MRKGIQKVGTLADFASAARAKARKLDRGETFEPQVTIFYENAKDLEKAVKKLKSRD